MFDKMLKSIVRKQLTENALTRLNGKIANRHYEKIGAIIRFPDGTEGVDMDIVGVSNLKRSIFYMGVVVPTAAILGNVLGNMSSRK